MQAAVVYGVGDLRVADVPEPELQPFQARVEILCGATCTGTDWHIIEGRMPFAAPCPTILGHESVGRVVELGPGVCHLKVGDVVTRVGTRAAGGFSASWGGFAERGVAVDWRAAQEAGRPEGEWRMHRRERVLPQDVDPGAATMFITWRETLSYLTRMGLSDAGASLLLLGSGGTALSFAAHARHAGAKTITMVGSAAREDTARRAGVTHFFAYRDESWTAQVREAVSGGYGFVIDTLGRAGGGDILLPFVRSGGTFGVYGIDERYYPIDLRKRPSSFTFFDGRYDEAETHDEVLARYQSGALDAALWFEGLEPFALRDIGAAYRAVKERRAVKALVRVTA